MRCPVPKFRYLLRVSLRSFVPLLGLSLLGYMVFRTGPGAVWKQVQAVGWGLALIIILGGFSQLIKTCAWRQTLACDIGALSWSRSFGAQLASDAAGQLGFAGKLLGEGLRVSLLRPAVSVADGISSSAIDGGLHTLTAAVVTLLGITATLLLTPLPGTWRVYALILAVVLVAVVALATVAVVSRWQLMGNSARAIARLPWVHKFVKDCHSMPERVQHQARPECDRIVAIKAQQVVFG
jgi:Lysylphosphatidylglycerol synthase TM region